MRSIANLSSIQETTGVTALMQGISCGAFLGDKAYDADWLREMLTARGIEPVIPARKGRKHYVFG